MFNAYHTRIESANGRHRDAHPCPRAPASAIPARMSEMATDGPEMPTPGEGMVFSTVKVTRTQNAIVRVEHPAEMSKADVVKAVSDRAMDLAPQIGWYDADTVTKIVGIGYKTGEPDYPGQRPFKVGV